ncbi:alpha/beta hydrolase [Photobacterium minamisatsumaniensis]|uniref:PGAP1-like alpha/beta domain-containing protein n=1 Tax=Photobacterium minamisatsumaniensis TaxID=2910233 RepID=UPI003D149C65
MISKNNLGKTFQSLKDELSSKVFENTELAKEKMTQFFEQGMPPAQSEAFQAVLNGVIGDHLERNNSRLASRMAFSDQNQTLSDSATVLSTQLPDASSRIILCVHGWCMADKGWQRKGHDMGQSLASSGYTPIYLRYNTGNHISLNGEEFAFRLEKLVQAWPCEVTELVIIGHSMGGLVTRSACHYAEENQLGWLSVLQTFITLGTPHNGAPLAQLACWIDDLVANTPQLKLIQKIGEIRSSGTKDLSKGYTQHIDWQQRDSEDEQVVDDLPFSRPILPVNTHCYAIATCLGKNLKDDNNRRLGDGLVPVKSALGESTKGVMALAYPEENKWVAGGINHLDLLSHPRVIAKVKEWVLLNTIDHPSRFMALK